MTGIEAAIAIAIFEAGAVSFGTAIAVASAITSLTASFALSFAANTLLAKKPSTNLSGQGQTVTVRDPIKPRPVIYGETRVGGTIVFMATSPFANKANAYLHLVIALAGHECESIESLYFDDYELPLNADGAGYYTQSGRYYKDGSDGGAFVYVEKYTGGADQTASQMLIDANVGWTSAHRLRGITYLYVRLHYHPDLFPSGVPNISALVRGRKVYDPRTGTTAWSTNAALCLRDYLTDDTYGLGCADDEIDDALVIAAANVCDEWVTLASGADQRRYDCNGSFATDAEPKDVIPALLSAMAGKAIWSGGEWRIFAGAYQTPTVTLDEDDLRAGFRTVNRVTRRELFNGVKGTHVGPANAYQPADFPPVTNATYLAQDNGERIWKDVSLAFTATASMAQRLAKIDLERMRQQISIPTLPCKLTAFRVRAGDVIGLTNARKGWTAKPFEVTSWQLVVEGDQDAPVIGVDLGLREIASTVYDWSSGEETTVDAAPDTDLPDPFDVAQPGAPTVTEALYETRDGAGVKAKAVLVWAASADGFVDLYQPEYRLVGATAWNQLPRTSDLTAEVLDIAPGIYDFRVKGINILGVPSAYSTTRKEIFGLGAEPSAVTGLSLQAISGIAILRWALHPDLDVRIGGRIEFRHSEATSGATWAQSVRIGEAVPGNATMTALPLKAGTYLARAYDSSDVPAAMVASVTTNAAEVLTFSTVGSVTEDPTFGGTHDDTVVSGSALQLAAGGDFDSIADFDAVVNLDAEGGILPIGTYEFAAGIDLTTVKSVRLRPTVEALVSNVAANIDDRTAPVDDWTDWDGTTAADCDAQIYVRQTDDDPAASPTWSDWTLLTMGDYRARAFQFKVELTSNDEAYNIALSQLRVSADEVV